MATNSSFASFNRVMRFTSRPLPSKMTRPDSAIVILEHAGDECYRVHSAGLYQFVRGLKRAQRIASAAALRSGAPIIVVGDE